MKIFVKAKPGAREEKIEKVEMPDGEAYFAVSVKEPPSEGRANEAIIKMLAKHFDAAPSDVRLVSGRTSRRKVFEVDFVEREG